MSPPTAEIPLMGIRKRTLLESFSNGSRLDFMLAIYKLAEQDLAELRIGSSRWSKRNFLNIMINDRDSGQLDMLKLLLTLSDEILESLILNTIGSKYILEPNFQKLFPKMENSGIYLNTILSGNHPGKGLNGREWNQVTTLISRYIRGQGKVLSNTSTAMEREDALIASSLETVYGPRPQTGGRRSEPYGGQRYWLNEGNTTEVFRQTLSGRSNLALDHTQMIRQIQSPCEVGMSHDMASRIKCHLPESGLKNTVKPWGLVLSCLKHAQIDFTIVSIPILQVWDKSLIGKAEILITFLAGSSFDEGGFNPAPPGGIQSLSLPEPLENGAMETFHQNDDFLKNLRECEEDLTKKIETLATLTGFDPDSPPEDIDERENQLKDIRSCRLNSTRAMREATAEMKEELKLIDPTRINEASSRIERRNQFSRRLDEWLSATTPSEKDK
ncbi:hypothetical protein MFRU_017g00460 [Monilinia fructicola]|nr:hypothetical protein MFRU_017g00460 [Monilinia fructicola]